MWHLCDIETSKNDAKRRCLVHFDLQMCFAPQRRAILRHLNFKKWPEAVSFLAFWLQNVLLATAACNFAHLNFKKWFENAVFCTFWLQNVLLATAAFNFSTSQLQKVVRECSVLYILTSKCASRYSGVQFFHIWTSKSGPRMQCFVHVDFKMCFSLQRRAIFHFRAQRPPPHPPLYRGYFSTQPTHKSLKNTAFRDFPNIVPVDLLSTHFRAIVSSFFWLYFSSLLFHLLTLLLCSAFSTVHMVGS